MDHRDVAGSLVSGLGRRMPLGFALAALSLAPAAAKELKLPADRPSVVFEVPDPWSVEATANGTELRAPEKNAIVIAKVIDQKKAAVESFAKTATEALKAFGVSFAADAKAAAKPTARKPEGKTPAKANLSSFQSKPENFTFSGSPSLAMPGTASSNDPQKNAPNSLESLTGFGSPAKSKQLPLRAAQYFGTSLNGKPVDVQLVLFKLPDNHYFAMMQESGSDDSRTVAMAHSVKSAKEHAP